MASEGEDRGAALLTPAQREYLRGERDLEGQSARAARARIRNRIQNGILDFAWLDELEDRDIEQIFSPSSHPPDREDTHLFQHHLVDSVPNYPGGPPEEADYKMIHQRSGIPTDYYAHLDIIEGLHTALGFLYRATETASIPFEHFLKTAIKRSLEDPTRYDVDVSISVKARSLPADVETAMRRIQYDEQLTDAEFRLLVEEGSIDANRVIEHSTELKEKANERRKPELDAADLPDFDLNG